MGNNAPTLDDDLFPIEEDVHSTATGSPGERQSKR